MKALILAAGMGWRLGGAFGRRPKCLLSFGGISLLERHIKILRSLGIVEVVVGVGYEAGQIRTELERIAGGTVPETVFNPDFHHGNIVTLWRMRRHLRVNEPLLLMDADVLYDPRLLARLVRSAHQNCFLMDRSFEIGDEPVKIFLSGGKIVECRKQVDETIAWEEQGESVGFFKLSPELASTLSRVTEAFIEDGRLGELYEEALREILLDRRGEGFGVEDITGLPWIEIDYREDVEKAEREILPMLEASLAV